MTDTDPRLLDDAVGALPGQVTAVTLSTQTCMAA